jgi:ADP-ribosylglycohydrolase
MISDDTEHACMAAQALLASSGDPDEFARSLAWRFRGWLAGLPAGVGLATLKSILRLWVGFSWRTSGVCSAGNGPAMRAPLLGVFARDDPELLRQLVNRSTRITHTDPLAEQGALLIALAAAHAAKQGPDHPDLAEYLDDAFGTSIDDRYVDALEKLKSLLEEGASVDDYARALGLVNGVSGYVLHTVPVCLYCWLRHHDDFRGGIESIVSLGGDTDTTGAITGGLLGAGLGRDAIPEEWLTRLVDWPRSVSWMGRLSDHLTAFIEQGVNEGPLPLFWPGLLPRNLMFMAVILFHGFRRLLPPY